MGLRVSLCSCSQHRSSKAGTGCHFPVLRLRGIRLGPLRALGPVPRNAPPSTTLRSGESSGEERRVRISSPECRPLARSVGREQATSSSTASILGSAEHQAGAQDGMRRAGRAGKGLSAACPPQEAGGRMMQQGLPPGALGGEFITEMCLRSARRRQPLGLPSLMLSLGFLGPP